MRNEKGFVGVVAVVLIVIGFAFLLYGYTTRVNVTPVAAGVKEKFPIPNGFLNDFAGVLSKDAIARITAKVSGFKGTAEIAVVTVKDMGGETIEGYANGFYNAWGIGKKGKDNGVLLIIAVKERKVRIEVGYGLEPVLPDSIAKRIIDTNMVPHLKKNDFSKGMEAGVDGVIKRLQEKK